MARYLDALTQVQSTLGYGLRHRLKEGYTQRDLRADIMAGIVVGVVALPLSMALAIASGVAPQYGLYTAIMAGAVCALLGGTRAQVTGPTAAFVVILVPIVTTYGFGGLLVAGLIAGVMLIGMGIVGLGRLIQYIPHPVTTGFTAGIAVVIATIQLKDIFGLKLDGNPESYFERWELMWHARASISGWEVLIAALTLAMLIGLPRLLSRSRWLKQIPAPLIALGLAAVIVVVLSKLVPGFHVATIGSRFHSVVGGREVAGIPPLPPLPLVPWHMPGPDGHTPMLLSFQAFRALVPGAFAIAMLGAIESLLAAVVADGMTGSKHDPNAELLALGVANVLCPFFGGIAATGALARTATNIRAGARSPISAVVHSVFVLLCTVALAPLVAYLPMAALAALLLIVAKNMSEVRHFLHILRVAPRSDVIVLLTCFSLTVIFDMVVAVSVGVVLAALLFMRRMAEIAEARLVDPSERLPIDLPPGVRLYEIQGPLFFGAAEKAMGVFNLGGESRLTVILSLAQVPAIDATGLVALETMLGKLRRAGHKVILSGLQKQPADVLARAHIERVPGALAIVPDLDTALSVAILHEARQPTPSPAQSPPPVAHT